MSISICSWPFIGKFVCGITFTVLVHLTPVSGEITTDNGVFPFDGKVFQNTSNATTTIQAIRVNSRASEGISLSGFRGFK